MNRTASSNGQHEPNSSGRADAGPMDKPASTAAATSVAQAPKNETLYESLLRYHEDDSDDDESVKPSSANADEFDDDRKPAAKPPASKLIQRPKIYRPYSNRQMDALNSHDRPALENGTGGSFYKSALETAEKEGTSNSGESSLYPITSGIDSPGNIVPKSFQNDIPAQSLMTAESRRAIPPRMQLVDELLAIQQVSAMSLKDNASIGMGVETKDEELEDPQKQAELWQKIQEEQERKQLEEAMRESKMASGGGTVDFVRNEIPSDIPREFIEEHLASERAQSNQARTRNNAPATNNRNNRLARPPQPRSESPPPPPPPPPGVSDLAPSAIPPRESPADFLISQQMAMEEWRSAHGGSEKPKGGGTSRGNRPPPRGPQQQSAGFVPPQRGGPPANDELLRQGHRETREAISNGTAHVVQCRGCMGRLHAPVSYALVFCPNCKTVSPGQTYSATPPRGSERKKSKEKEVKKEDSFRRRSNPKW